MHYFRNFELAKQYHVSQTAVGKWIEATKAGRLTLDLIEHEGKSYIAATSKNRVTIEALVQDRKKYFNSKSHKTVTPKAEFYTIYMPDQILDIITSLDVRSEIARQYGYVGDGARIWDEYQKKLLRENPNDTPRQDIKLLIQSYSYIDNLLERFSKINIVDVGPGNGMPARDMLEHFIKQNILGHYLAIDISPEMLNITEENIKEWFGKQVHYKGDVRDITFERFAELLASSNISDNVANLILFLGGTLSNFAMPEEAIRTLYYSLNRDDVLIYSLKLDTGDNRRIFDFSQTSSLAANHRLLVDMLNIDESLYDVIMAFDEQQKERQIRIQLKSSLSIIFSLPQGERVVEFKKDESILVWRYKHQSAEEVIKQFTNNGFNILQSSQTPDHEFMLLVCDLKTERKK